MGEPLQAGGRGTVHGAALHPSPGLGAGNKGGRSLFTVSWGQVRKRVLGAGCWHRVGGLAERTKSVSRSKSKSTSVCFV